MLPADKKWARQTVRTAMQYNSKFLRTRQYYMPRYIKRKPGIQMPRQTKVRRTGSFALNSATMQLYYCRYLWSTELMGKAATEPQKLLSSLLFQNIDWSRWYNAEGLMFCKSDCFEGQDLCYNVSAKLSEKQNRQTPRAWRSPIRFSVFLCRRTKAYTHPTDGI